MSTTTDAGGRRIVVLAASAFVVLAAEPLFLLVDTAVVGHLGRVPLAGLAVGGTVMSVLAIVGTALEYGTTGRAARLFGAGRRDAAVAEGVQASWLALAVGLAAVVLGELLAGPVSRAVAGGPGEVAAAAESWLRIAVLGVPGLLLVTAGNGWLRGVQSTRTPVVVVLCANLASAVASPLLVYPGGLGLRGSAVANVLAQWVGGCLCVGFLHRERPARRPDQAVMRAQLLVGRDFVVRAVAFEASFLAAAAVAARMGSAQLAAHQIGLQVWGLIALLLDSFAVAAQSLVGAALGRGDAAAARATAWRVTRYGLGMGLVLGALVAAGWDLVPAAFTGDSRVRSQAHVVWPWIIAMSPLGGVLFALDGVLMGAGDTAYLRTVSVGGALLGFLPMTALALPLGLGLSGVWAGLALFVVLRLVAMTVRTRGRAWAVLGPGAR